MPTNARKKHRVGTGGPWGTGLLLLGIGCVMQGVGYVSASPAGLPPALASLATTIPIWLWGVLWMAAGLSAVFQALTPPQRHRDVWPVVGITVLWTAVYGFHYALGAIGAGDWSSRSWYGAVVWGCMAALIACWGRCVNPPSSDQ